jgi:hypothetical protein
MRAREVSAVLKTSSLLTNARTALSMLATTICLGGARKRYHPEDHYMRGRGPKWREKHLARQSK